MAKKYTVDKFQLGFITQLIAQAQQAVADAVGELRETVGAPEDYQLNFQEGEFVKPEPVEVVED